MDKFCAVIVAFLVPASIAFAGERNAVSYLIELPELNQETFVELGQFIIDDKDTVRIMTVSGGGFIAGYDVLLSSGYFESAEISLSVLDVDMSGDFNLGDGLLIIAFDDKFGFEYVEEGVVSLNFDDRAELQAALKRVADNGELVMDIAALTDSFGRINQQLEQASAMYNSVK